MAGGGISRWSSRNANVDIKRIQHSANQAFSTNYNCRTYWSSDANEGEKLGKVITHDLAASLSANISGGCPG